jgi:hypothetical protein
MSKCREALWYLNLCGIMIRDDDGYLSAKCSKTGETMPVKRFRKTCTLVHEISDDSAVL